MLRGGSTSSDMHTKSRKVVVLGSRGVGKTSLVLRHMTGKLPDVYSPTIENNYVTTATTGKRHSYEIEVNKKEQAHQLMFGRLR